MLLNVVLNLVKSLHLLEMTESFGTTAQLVIDVKFASKGRNVVERLKVGKVLPWVLLRLLCNEKRKFEIVYPECGIVKLIDIGKKADVLCSSFGKRILGDLKFVNIIPAVKGYGLTLESPYHLQTGLQICRDLTHMCSDEILEMVLLVLRLL